MSKRMNQLAKRIADRLVVIDHNQAWTTSLVVADRFGKQHKDVMRSIQRALGPSVSRRNFAPPDPASRPKNGARKKGEVTLTPNQAEALRAEFAAENFKLSTYIDERGKEQPMYLLREDGYRKVVMGFTGERADVWQILFIREFRRMEDELMRRRALQLNEQWQQERSIGKAARRQLTDKVQEFTGYAKDQGSEHPDAYYLLLTKVTSRALFDAEDGIYEGLRDRLTPSQLQFLASAERAIDQALGEAMEQGLPYKECFEFAKTRVVAFAGFIGKSFVPNTDHPLPQSALPKPEAPSLF